MRPAEEVLRVKTGALGSRLQVGAQGVGTQGAGDPKKTHPQVRRPRRPRAETQGVGDLRAGYQSAQSVRDLPRFRCSPAQVGLPHSQTR